LSKAWSTTITTQWPSVLPKASPAAGSDKNDGGCKQYHKQHQQPMRRKKQQQDGKQGKKYQPKHLKI